MDFHLIVAVIKTYETSFWIVLGNLD